VALKLEDYALISDSRSAALVGRDGSIDWLTFPRFDSPACFAALLGTPDNGRWRIAPTGRFEATRRYLDGTMVLETTFRAAGGTCSIVDCMLTCDDDPTLVRLVRGIEGRVALALELIIRFDYGSIIPWVHRLDGTQGISAVGGPEALLVASPVPLQGRDMRTVAEFSVSAGEELPFTLIWHRSEDPLPRLPPEPPAEVRRTVDYWKGWSGRSTYNGLKALTYQPTGGIIAAPTTSLPETLGGRRNWDYRYAWIRDSAFTLQALLLAGYRDEAEAWNQWLLRAVAGTPEQVNIMYGLAGERRLTEIELPWLAGYEGSRPVRVGNGAHAQVQLDIFGELLLASDLGRRAGLPRSADFWRVECKLIDYLSAHWTDPDEGIWEVRVGKRHFTHSKMMAWVAVDRAIKAMTDFGLEGDLAGWTKLRERIHADVCAQGYDPQVGAFTQSYGSKALDASLLLMPIFGFLPADDPRVVGTVAAIERDLVREGFVMRYRRTDIEAGNPDEGSFLACSFWLADCYAAMGRRREAEELFERLCGLRNDVGLFSEEYSSVHKRLVGNFPQTFSHIGHIVAADTLSQFAKKRSNGPGLQAAAPRGMGGV
jgi:GH15 family glucan-1,4-alpha-glucosidase